MAKQKTKMELLKDIQVERRLLDRTVTAVPREELTRGEVVGEWSVKDILAHLTAWEQLFLSWYNAGLQGNVPESHHVGMSVKAIAELNQHIYMKHQKESLEDVLTKSQDSYGQIYAAVEGIPEVELFYPGRYPWTGKWSLADYVAGNTCNHYYWARTKIRSWLKARKPE